MQRLYKSNENRVFDGVCGGLGDYLGIDPVIIRLIWVLMALFGGSGVIAYAIAMLIIPRRSGSVERTQAPVGESFVFTNRFWGLILLVLGLLMLLRFLDPVLRVLLGMLPVVAGMVLPLFILLAGLYLLLRRDKAGNSQWFAGIFPSGRHLTRVPENGKIAGVCAGFARYFDLDDNLMRLIWILAAFTSLGFVLLAYALLAVFLPQSDPLQESSGT